MVPRADSTNDVLVCDGFTRVALQIISSASIILFYVVHSYIYTPSPRLNFMVKLGLVPTKLSPGWITTESEKMSLGRREYYTQVIHMSNVV